MNERSMVPVYLLVDLYASADRSARRRAALNEFLSAFVAEVRSDPGYADRIRLDILGFDTGVTGLGVLDPLSAYTPLPALEPRDRSSYSSAFRGLDKIMRNDLADRETPRPLLIILAYAEPSPDDTWMPAYEELLSSWPGLTVRPIRSGPDLGWADRLWQPPERERPDVTGWVPKAVSYVRDHLDRLQSQPPPGTRPPEPRWKGSFEGYSVGEPGNAALRVRPLPDPAEWDRRDTVLDGFEIRGEHGAALAHLRAASTRGLSHRHYGTVRQDEYAYRRTPDGRYLVVAVADGVSSGKLSHLAAGLITRVGSDILVKALGEGPLTSRDWHELVVTLSHQIVVLARDRLEWPDHEPVSTGAVVQHMAATALFGVVDLHQGETGHRVEVFAVGDSSAWILSGDRWEPLHQVKNSGDGPASATTRALPTSPESLPAPVSTSLRSGEALVLMSDGIGDPLRDGANDVGAFLAEVWREPPPALAFAAQVDFARRSHDDDRTAVAVWAV